MGPKRTARAYADANLEAARIIASDPMRYPGVMQTWAHLIIGRIEAPPADAEAGPLFQVRRAA